MAAGQACAAGIDGRSRPQQEPCAAVQSYWQFGGNDAQARCLAAATKTKVRPLLVSNPKHYCWNDGRWLATSLLICRQLEEAAAALERRASEAEDAGRDGGCKIQLCWQDDNDLPPL